MKAKRANDYNVIYTSPSNTDRGLMPLGNGELGVSLWVTKDAICGYLSRSDSLTECDRNVKLGMFRIQIEPSVLEYPDFHQELVLEDGAIVLYAGPKECRLKMCAFVERERDVLRIGIESEQNVTIKCFYETWRKQINDSVNEAGNLSERSGISESADKEIFLQDGKLIYHYNQTSIIPYLAKLEGLESEIGLISDNLTGRVFGGILRMNRGYTSEDGAVQSTGKKFDILLYTFSEIGSKEEDIIQQKIDRSKEWCDFDNERKKTAGFWKKYFEESYIYVENDKKTAISVSPVYDAYRYENMEVNETDSCVTRAYILTKYMHCCCLNATYPMRFNGGHFNPGIGIPFGSAEQTISIASKTPFPPEIGKSPDERSWGNMLLWQNERLPYHPLFAQNNTQSIRSFLRYYCSFGEINNAKAKKYYDAKGAYNTEIMTSFGLMPDYVYGTERKGLPDGYCENRHGGAVDISPGLEQSYFLLKYCKFEKDDSFLNEVAIPYIKELFRYIETRFKERKQGKIVLKSLNSLETYWDTVNPVTVVAGMKAVLKELKIFKLSEEDRKFFDTFEGKVPDYSYELQESRKVLKPAEVFEDVRHNVENPQIYTIFPFDNQIEEIGIKTATESYWDALKVSENNCGMMQGAHSYTSSFSGWHYEGIVAARLGLADEAKKILEYNCSYQHINARFPAMWGPAYDSLPDTDHGSNLQTQLQEMIMQVKGSTIEIIPAFPKEWNCCFLLWVDKNTWVKGEIERGRVCSIECNNSEYIVKI